MHTLAYIYLKQQQKKIPISVNILILNLQHGCMQWTLHSPLGGVFKRMGRLLPYTGLYYISYEIKLWEIQNK